ncbi:MAG: hypothetical protein AB7G28_08895 [Pirellulales bacterium]
MGRNFLICLATCGALASFGDWIPAQANEIAAPSTTSSPKRIVEFAGPKANRAEPARKRFQAARSFYTYYGKGRAAELSHYDIAVLHPSQVDKVDVKRLSELGVVTVGYITIGEDERLQVGDGTGPGGKASWYFDGDRDGQPDQDPIWKSWYANTNDPAWRASRVAEARKLIDEYGFDGIFLDLISVSEMYPECRGGMIQMMRDLREALPDGVIVMNQGFDIVGDVAPLADGFMIESFTATYDFENKRYVLNDPAALDAHMKRAQKLLNPAIKNQSIRVMVLDYADTNDRQSIQLAANRAASLGYMFSVSPILLDDVYPEVLQGESDAKWLELYTTPERLAWKLPEPRNGFPAGTVATPSGNFPGYTVEPMFDPATDRSNHHWSKSAWASGEDGEAPWLRLRFPEPLSGGELTIAWHDASGPSREFRIQTRAAEDAEWRDADVRQDNNERVTRHKLPSEPFRELQISQSADGGSAGRPKLMWITRLELSR